MFVEINGNQYNTLNFTAYRYLATKDHPIGLEIHYAGGTKLIKDFESESERSAFTENLGDTYLVLNDIAYNALYFTAYYTEDVMLPTPSYNVVIHYAGATKLIKKSSTEAERNEFVKILEELSISSKYDDTELREKIADLKEEVDGVVAATDVKDIVGTYAALEQYDTSKLGDNDIIKVLQDETREYAQTYYRWHVSEKTFSYIGKEGPYYTRDQIDRKFEEVDQPIDNKTITKNSAQELQAVGVAESNKGTATKTWVGTQEEYDALASIDNDTLYYITDGVPEFGDGKTIAPNTEGLLQALGMIESNKGKVSKLWIGTKAEYDQIETKDEGTIYYLTDEEDIYATKKYVDDNKYTLPIASSETLGGIKVGKNLEMSEDGTLNAKGIKNHYIFKTSDYGFDIVNNEYNKNIFIKIVEDYMFNNIKIEDMSFSIIKNDSIIAGIPIAVDIRPNKQNDNWYAPSIKMQYICLNEGYSQNYHIIYELNAECYLYMDSKEITIQRFNSYELNRIYPNLGSGNALGINNNSSYTPTSDYNPATKKYVDDAVNNKQNTLVPGTNITIDENNVINAKGADKDNLTITENTAGELQSVGVLDSNTNTVTKVWTGTLAEYNAITSKDSGTIYYITDEEDTTATQEYVNNAIRQALGTIESELGGI